VEQLRGDFRIFGDVLAGVRAEMSLSQFRVDVDRRFGDVDRRFDRVESALMEHGRQLKEVRAVLERKAERDKPCRALCGSHPPRL
jgi:hypothetical protein